MKWLHALLGLTAAGLWCDPSTRYSVPTHAAVEVSATEKCAVPPVQVTAVPPTNTRQMQEGQDHEKRTIGR